MSFSIAARPNLVRDIKAMLPRAALKGWGHPDTVLCPTGVYYMWGLAIVAPPRGWRRNWSLPLRQDGKLCLMYHVRQFEPANILKRVEHPVQQKAFAISLGPFWRFLPRRVLTRVRYKLLEVVDPDQADYTFPIAAFAVRGRRAGL